MKLLKGVIGRNMGSRDTVEFQYSMDMFSNMDQVANWYKKCKESHDSTEEWRRTTYKFKYIPKPYDWVLIGTIEVEVDCL